MPKKSDWIQRAIKNPGALKAKAKAAGGVTKKDKISKAFIQNAKKSKNPTTRKQAVLAETLSKLRRGK